MSEPSRPAGGVSPRRALRQLLSEPRLTIAPGVYDGLSAIIAADLGFSALYASGGAIARSTGVPDVGLLTFTEVLARTQQIIDAVRVPVIADADTGYGGPLNVARTVREFERIGVAAIHIEDQINPKRCGHRDVKAVVDVSTMKSRLRAAIGARTDPDLVIIARTDALAIEGHEAAIRRAQEYLAVGADMAFVEAPESLEQLENIARSISNRLVVNMFHGGKTPLVAPEVLESLGYRVMLVPSDLQRAAIFAIREAAEMLKLHSSTRPMADRIVTFQEREAILREADFVAMEERYLSDGTADAER
jgi:2-methylisocitrate lyase-like PEP mutase family enzyme